MKISVDIYIYWVACNKELKIGEYKSGLNCSPALPVIYAITNDDPPKKKKRKKYPCLDP